MADTFRIVTFTFEGGEYGGQGVRVCVGVFSKSLKLNKKVENVATIV